MVENKDLIKGKMYKIGIKHPSDTPTGTIVRVDEIRSNRNEVYVTIINSPNFDLLGVDCWIINKSYLEEQ
jgi:hypothetical protein